MDCKICYENFNLDSRQPIMLDCGHTFCKACLTRICFRGSECPLDKSKISKSLSQLKPNYSLLELIENLSLADQPKHSPKSALNISRLTYPKSLHSSLPAYSSSLSIKCLSGHDLNYISDTSSLHSQITGHNEFVLCYLCNKSCTGGSWHCRNCRNSMCDTCYRQEISARNADRSSILRCSNHHSMYFYEDTTGFYRRKNNTSGGIYCDMCEEEWQGSSWSCRVCSYDLCLICKEVVLASAAEIEIREEVKSSRDSLRSENSRHEARYSNRIPQFQMPAYLPSPSRSSAVCPKNHPISSLPITESPYFCIVCKMTKKCPAFSCKKCSYVICQVCYNYYTQNFYIESDTLKCSNNHRLIRSDDQNKMYQLRFGPSSFREYCNSCGNGLNGFSNHCRQCDFDLCDECVSIMLKSIQKGLRIKCSANHVLNWYYDTSRYYSIKYSDESFYCNLCRKKFKNIGSFHCRNCEYDVCVKCCNINMNQ